jgi:coniferyl-aldehyde dehydrogenase
MMHTLQKRNSDCDLRSLLDRQRSEFIRAGIPPMKQRLADLQKLKRVLFDKRHEFAAAISEDFGHRSAQESLLLDIAGCIDSIKYMRSQLAKWMRVEHRSVGVTFMPASAKVCYQPVGVVGIIAPWNYPVALTMTPLATALAAGNRAMVKPSELVPATSELIKAVLTETFPQDQVAVVTGDADVASAFSHLAFDHLLFTGSTAIGRSVMRAASENLVPVTLELGGKSPTIVERGANLARVARLIAYGKLANAGQTCIAPDYALVAHDEVERFAQAYQAAVASLYPEVIRNPDYTSIISDHHHARLVALLEDAKAKGAIVQVSGADSSQHPSHPRTLAPALVLAVTDDMHIMQQEIFGPLLPVVAYQTIEDAVSYVNARPRPLALYYFGPKGPHRDLVLQNTTSGGVGINETLLQYAQHDLPFGGIGPSGMGAYHGKEGFIALSHAKAVFEQSAFNFTDSIRPPFGKIFDRALKFILR